MLHNDVPIDVETVKLMGIVGAILAPVLVTIHWQAVKARLRMVGYQLKVFLIGEDDEFGLSTIFVFTVIALLGLVWIAIERISSWFEIPDGVEIQIIPDPSGMGLGFDYVVPYTADSSLPLKTDASSNEASRPAPSRDSIYGADDWSWGWGPEMPLGPTSSQ